MAENLREPSPPYKVVTREINGFEYTAGFYPGFARSIAVGGVSLYDQTEAGPFPFNLPDGEGPLPSSPLNISSSKGYCLTLWLDDSEHAIDSLEVVVRDPGKSNGGGVQGYEDGNDVWTFNNTPTLCPPFC
jgi:hypothetical protein